MILHAISGGQVSVHEPLILQVRHAQRHIRTERHQLTNREPLSEKKTQRYLCYTITSRWLSWFLGEPAKTVNLCQKRITKIT